MCQSTASTSDSADSRLQGLCFFQTEHVAGTPLRPLSRVSSAAWRLHTRRRSHGDELDPIGPREGVHRPEAAGPPPVRRHRCRRRDSARKGGGGDGPLRPRRRRAPELDRFSPCPAPLVLLALGLGGFSSLR